MKKVTSEELQHILSEHDKWRKSEDKWLLTGEREGKRADFRGVDLSEMDFSGKDLSLIDFRGSDLTDADLAYSSFAGAYIDVVDFSDANLAYSNFKRAYIDDTSFTNTNLYKADFSGLYNFPDFDEALNVDEKYLKHDENDFCY